MAAGEEPRRSEKIESVARATPSIFERFRTLISQGLGHVVGASIVGLVAGLLSAVISGFEFVQQLLEFINRPMKSGFLDLLATTAYAATEPLQAPALSGILKSMILAGIFISLFILFVWALYTLSKSSNAKAIDVAVEAIKMLAGFFIGALTGFLGA